jgi:hypothetical protein
MQAIGASDMNPLLRPAGNTAAANGAGAPASAVAATSANGATAGAAAGAADMSSLAEIGIDGPIEIPVVAATIDDFQALTALNGRTAVPHKLKFDTPTVGSVLANLDRADVDSVTPLLDKREKLVQAIKDGRGDTGKLLNQLSDLDVIIKLIRRAEEKKALMKQLMKRLLMGVLTPETIRLAKAAGLVSFIKEAIRELVKKGMFSPQAAKGLGAVLAAAGIVMPELDEVVLIHEKKLAGQVDAARAARGIPPVDIAQGISGSASAMTGAATLATATTKARS